MTTDPPSFPLFVLEHWTECFRIFVELSTLFGLLLSTWSRSRERKWQARLLALSQQQGISRQNETVRILSTAFASGEPLTLDDLLSSAERDFTLRSSEKPSEPPSGMALRPMPPPRRNR